MGYYCYRYASSVEVVDNSEKWTFDRLSDPSASVSLWVPGNLVWPIIMEMLTPLVHPMFPFMFVKTVSMNSLGKGTAHGHTMEHSKCQLDVSYAVITKTYNESIAMQAQMVTLPKWRFRWSNGRMLSDGEEPSRIVRTQKITHSYDRLVQVPGEIFNNIGKVNNTAITTSQGLVCAPETLLYEGADSSRQFQTFGLLGFSAGWQVTTNFSYNPNGWNRWFNTVQGDWLTFQTYRTPRSLEDIIHDSQSGNQSTADWTEFKMYEPANISDVFYCSGA